MLGGDFLRRTKRRKADEQYLVSFNAAKNKDHLITLSELLYL
jgi:hypothetical protein